MAGEQYDFCVIGAGSGGIRAARLAANLGARVIVVEQGPLGGTCVNAGCVPKKLFFHAAEFAEAPSLAASFGWRLSRESFDWKRLVENKNWEIKRLNGIYEEILGNAGVRIVRGRAQLLAPGLVRVSEQKIQPGDLGQRAGLQAQQGLSEQAIQASHIPSGAVATDISGVSEQEICASHILIATGALPVEADFPGAEHLVYSDALFHLPSLPGSLAIIGGGYIAIEFACIFNLLGVKVDIIYRGELFLRGFARPLRQALADTLRARGLALHFNTRVQSIEDHAEGLRLHLHDGSSLKADRALCAIGRRPNTQGLGLEALGVETDARGAVLVDQHYRSRCDGIHAIGDVTDRVNLTPVAIAEGAALAQRLFGAGNKGLDYSLIPHCVFSQPPLAQVGLTEQSARQKYPNVLVFQSRFRPLRQALAEDGQRSLVQLIVDGDSDRVLGAHMIGEQAPEIIQGLALAMRAGLGKSALDECIGIHPSSAEEFIGLRE